MTVTHHGLPECLSSCCVRRCKLYHLLLQIRAHSLFVFPLKDEMRHLPPLTSGLKLAPWDGKEKLSPQTVSIFSPPTHTIKGYRACCSCTFIFLTVNHEKAEEKNALFCLRNTFQQVSLAAFVPTEVVHLLGGSHAYSSFNPLNGRICNLLKQQSTLANVSQTGGNSVICSGLIWYTDEC